jgi:hypothetical protein
MPDYPNRCQHLKINGTQCGSPALRRNRFCFFHKRFQDERIKLSADRARRGVATFVLPVLEDANSIQIALMQVMRLLVARQLDHKTASLLLYALQTASTNLRLTNFKPFSNDVILDPRDVTNTPLDSHIWDDEDFEEQPGEEETEADRAIAALETARRKKQEDAKWMKWAEAQYPKPKPAAHPSAAITASGSAVVTPEVAPELTPEVSSELKPETRSASPPKKPASSLNPAKIRQEISDMIRKEFLPRSATPGGSKPTG